MADIELEIVEDSEDIELEIVEAKLKPEQSKRVIPGYSEQTVLPDAGMTLGSVTVDPIPEPTERLTITENGEYDVARIGSVDVDVPQSSGWVFEDFNADYYPTTAHFVASPKVNKMGRQALGGRSTSQGFLTHIDKIVLDEGLINISAQAFEYRDVSSLIIPSSVTSTGDYFCRYCKQLEYIEYRCDAYIGYYLFGGSKLRQIVCRKDIARNTIFPAQFPSTMELYDFSHCAKVPSLQNNTTIGYTKGCVILVPAALLDEWQNALYWRELPTDPTLDAYVIWEGV